MTPSWHVEPPTTPDPEEYPRDDSVCGHAEEYGRTITMGERVVRCGRCSAPVDFHYPSSDKCSCQLAGGYDTECLLTGRCAEGRKA